MNPPDYLYTCTVEYRDDGTRWGLERWYDHRNEPVAERRTQLDADNDPIGDPSEVWHRGQ